MVGQRPLKPLIGVRFPVSQQSRAKRKLCWEKQIENLRQGIEGRSGLQSYQRLSRVADTRKISVEKFLLAEDSLSPSFGRKQILNLFSPYKLEIDSDPEEYT